jgi:hypothetical protein
MKIIKSRLAWSVMILGSSLLGGCYTQLALNDEEPAVVIDTHSSVTVLPPPLVISVEPFVVPILPSYDPSPGFEISASEAGAHPQSESARRSIGNQRSDSGRSESSGPSSTTRTVGSARGQR